MEASTLSPTKRFTICGAWGIKVWRGEKGIPGVVVQTLEGYPSEDLCTFEQIRNKPEESNNNSVCHSEAQSQFVQNLPGAFEFEHGFVVLVFGSFKSLHVLTTTVPKQAFRLCCSALKRHVIRCLLNQC